MIPSWFFLSTLNYDARSTTHQILMLYLKKKTLFGASPNQSCEWLVVLKKFTHPWRNSPVPGLLHPYHSIYGATVPSGPWPPSQDASIHPYFQLFSSILLSTAVVMHPSGQQPPISFLVFPLVLWCRCFRLKPFLWSFLLPFLLCDLPILPNFQSLFKVSLIFFSSWPLSLC